MAKLIKRYLNIQELQDIYKRDAPRHQIRRLSKTLYDRMVKRDVIKILLACTNLTPEQLSYDSNFDEMLALAAAIIQRSQINNGLVTV